MGMPYGQRSVLVDYDSDLGGVEYSTACVGRSAVSKRSDKLCTSGGGGTAVPV